MAVKATQSSPQGRWKCPDCGAWVRDDVEAHLCYHTNQQAPNWYTQPPWWYYSHPVPYRPYYSQPLYGNGISSTSTAGASGMDFGMGISSTGNTYGNWTSSSQSVTLDQPNDRIE